MRCHPGDTGYILVSNRTVEQVRVLAVHGEFCVLQLASHRPSGIRLRQSRVFRTAEEATASIKKHVEPPQRHPPEYWL